jgi:hypothetical protein
MRLCAAQRTRRAGYKDVACNPVGAALAHPCASRHLCILHIARQNIKSRFCGFLCFRVLVYGLGSQSTVANSKQNIKNYQI